MASNAAASSPAALDTAMQHRSAKEKGKGKNKCEVLPRLGVALVILGSSVLAFSSTPRPPSPALLH